MFARPIACLLGQVPPPPVTPDPSWLTGSITAPFPLVAALAGLLTLGVLVYYARRTGR